MRMVYIKKKKGTSFLEIIIALSIIGIISVTIFNNIAFSLKANKVIDRRQNSSILAQHVFEEVKNMGDFSFKNLAKSMTDDLENGFLGEGFIEIRGSESKAKFKKDDENIKSFKVFNKLNTELYVKVSLPKLNKESQGAGLVNTYETKLEEKLVEEWKTLNKCEVGMEITKQKSGDLYDVTFYNYGIPKPPYQRTKMQLVPKVSLEDNKIKVYLKKEIIFEKDILKKLPEELTEVNMYIKDNTGGNLFYIFSNDEYLGLNIYLEQNSTGNSNFVTYGKNVRVYSNEKGETPYGENITTESVCDFTVEVYRKDGDDFKKIVETKGHKKFKRFEL